MAESRFTGTLKIGKGEIEDEHLSSSAAVDVDKQQHLHKPSSNFDLAIAATPVAREEIVFVASTAGVLRGFHAILNDTGTTTDVDFDIKKNGTTMLSSTVNVTNADADKLVKDGTLSVTSFAADDVISFQLTVTTSTGAQGPYCWAEIQETAAAS